MSKYRLSEGPADFEYKAMLEWRMCSDPFPVSETKQLYIDQYLDYIAREFGYEDWIDAYHKIK